jgi:hypothetical protein
MYDMVWWMVLYFVVWFDRFLVSIGYTCTICAACNVFYCAVLFCAVLCCAGRQWNWKNCGKFRIREIDQR